MAASSVDLTKFDPNMGTPSESTRGVAIEIFRSIRSNTPDNSVSFDAEWFDNIANLVSPSANAESIFTNTCLVVMQLSAMGTKATVTLDIMHPSRKQDTRTSRRPWRAFQLDTDTAAFSALTSKFDWPPAINKEPFDPATATSTFVPIPGFRALEKISQLETDLCKHATNSFNLLTFPDPLRTLLNENIPSDLQYPLGPICFLSGHEILYQTQR